MAIEVTGNELSQLFQEAGGHRIQRVPPTERKGRVHTSTVTVAVIDERRAVQEWDESDIRVEWYSGSGAGGQHRNKHQNSCRVIHVPTGLVRKSETRHRESSYRDAINALKGALSYQSSSQEHKVQNSARQAQVGSGMRGDKRRTYRFQEGVVKDHVNSTQSNIDLVMSGNFDKLWK